MRRLTFLFSLIAISMLTLTCGCTGNNPQLATYRSSLHALDSKIYADELNYIAEAESKGTRSVDVTAVQRRAIQQAESFYQSAETLVTPATAPSSIANPPIDGPIQGTASADATLKPQDRVPPHDLMLIR